MAGVWEMCVTRTLRNFDAHPPGTLISTVVNLGVQNPEIAFQFSGVPIPSNADLYYAFANMVVNSLNVQVDLVRNEMGQFFMSGFIPLSGSLTDLYDFDFDAGDDSVFAD
jgi:hypothetical protein